MRLSIRAGLVCAAALAVGLGALAPDARAQRRGGGAGAADLRALIDRHDEALNRHDLNALMALYAPGAKTIVMGTGPGERYQGHAAIREAYTEFFKDFDRGTLKHNTYWSDGARSGTTAWLAAMCKFSDSKGGKPREYELNISGAFEKRPEGWRIRMLHFSNLLGGDAPPSGG